MPPAPARSAAPAPTRSAAPAPVAQQPSAVGMPQQRQPGMMAQMAATAGGVAIGSTVVCVIIRSFIVSTAYVLSFRYLVCKETLTFLGEK